MEIVQNKNRISEETDSIIIMEMFKAPTLRLKALNKRSITHIMYIEMEMLLAIKKMYVRKRKKKANT